MPWGTFLFHQTSTEKSFNIQITAAKICTNSTTATFVQMVVLMILNVFYMPGWTNWAKGAFQQTLSLASTDVGCSRWAQ